VKKDPGALFTKLLFRNLQIGSISWSFTLLSARNACHG